MQSLFNKILTVSF